MPQIPPSFSLKILTINAHKGFAAFNRHVMLPERRDTVRTVGADIVCLQEVPDAHDVHPLRVENWPDITATPFYPAFPSRSSTITIFPSATARNGPSPLAHCAVPVHVFCTHPAGLREAYRRA